MVITDAMDMKGVVDFYKNESADVAALLAGNDLLLMPDDLDKSTESIISLDTLETLINHQTKGPKEDIGIQKNKNINFSNFFNEFLDRFFETIEDDNTQLNLYDKFLNEIEKPLIIKTLKYFKGNQIKTAKVLGINRNTLRSKIAKHNISKKVGKI